MRLRHVVPIIGLFLWQATPEPPTRDPSGHVRLWFGGGVSSFPYSYWDWVYHPAECCVDGPCSGETRHELVHRQAHTSLVGARLDAWPSDHLRVSASAAFGESPGSGAGANFPSAGGALAALELPILGIGAGYAHGPVAAGNDGPAAYLRLGPAGGFHLRADVRHPTPVPGAAGWARLGLASEYGRTSEVSLFTGVATVWAGPGTPFASKNDVPSGGSERGFFLEVANNGSELGFFVQGHLAASAWGLAAGFTAKVGP